MVSVLCIFEGDQLCSSITPLFENRCFTRHTQAVIQFCTVGSSMEIYTNLKMCIMTDVDVDMNINNVGSGNSREVNLISPICPKVADVQQQLHWTISQFNVHIKHDCHNTTLDCKICSVWSKGC
jgi:hypothetical protein